MLQSTRREGAGAWPVPCRAFGMRPLHDHFALRVVVAIRPCEERDLGPLEWFGSLTPHRKILRDQFERHVLGENVFLVADRGGFPIGQLWVDLVTRAAERAAVFWALRVIEPFQRLGIGQRLMSVGETIARRAGFEAVEIGVEKTNDAAARLYRRLGFEHVGEHVSEEMLLLSEGPVRRVSEQLVLRKPLRADGKTR